MEVKIYTFSVQINKAGTRGEPFDMNLIGWFADYPDPYDFVNVLLYGKTIAKLEQRQHGVLQRPGLQPPHGAGRADDAVTLAPRPMPRSTAT